MTSPAGWSYEALARELRYVAQGMVADTLKNEPRWGLTTQASTMTDTIVTTLRAEQHPVEPLAALKSVLEEAITNLGGQVCPGTNLVMQDAARLLFGFDELNQPGEKGKTYDAIAQYLWQQAGILKTEVRNRRQLTATIRQQVARNMLQLIEQAERASAYSQQPQIDGYVSVTRASLEGSILDTLRKAIKPVILWGESGNGKSYLARRLADIHFANQRVAVIRGPSGPKAPFMESDIVAALRSIGVNERFLSEVQLRTAFRDALNNREGFGLVIFDNADEWMVDAFVEAATVPVIVTTTHQINRDWGVSIRVRTFSDDEAIAFLQTALPSASLEEMKELSHYLGNRPIALMLASRLVRLSEITTGELLSAARDAPAVTVEASRDIVADPNIKSLTAVYRRVVAALSSDVLALEVLDRILWLTGSAQKDWIVAYTAQDSLSVAEDLAFRAAFLRLQNIGLVELQGDDVEINDLTIDFLRIERAESFDKVLRRFHQTNIKPAIEAAVDRFGSTETGGNVFDFLEIEAMFSNYHDDRYSGHRWVLVWEVAIFCQALLEFTPGMNIGLAALSMNRWLIWQQGFSWFMVAEDGEYQMALTDVEPDNLKLWHQGKPSRFDKESLLRIYFLVRFYDWIIPETLPQAFPEYIDEPEPDNLPVITISLNEEVSHRPLAVVTEEIAAEFRLPIWAACGVRYVPQLKLLNGSRFPPCSKCAAIAPLVNDKDAWFKRLAILNALIQHSKDTAYWALIVTVSTTMALLEGPDGALGRYERAVVATRSAPEEDHQLAVTLLIYTLYHRQFCLLSVGLRDQAADDLDVFKSLVEEGARGPGAAAWLLHRMGLFNRDFGLFDRALDLANTALSVLPLNLWRSDLQSAIADLIAELVGRDGGT